MCIRDSISIDSPLARALLKKRIDDEVQATLPGGLESFAVIDVSYAHLALSLIHI